ncbi:MAG: serine hydrolase, partial [bacterium]|nr:serine hydrolase [bacterium]
MQQRWFSPTIRNRSLKISHFGIWRSGARVLLMVSATLALVAEAHADCPGPWPQPDWTAATPAQMGLDESKLEQARDYALGAGGGSGIIVRSGRSVMNWGSQSTRYDLKSTTKSIGITALGLAVGDGLVAIDDAAQPHYSDFGIPPASNAVTGWLDDITLRHLATHSAGFPEDGGFYSLAAGPGLEFRYTNGGANWLADVLTVKFGQDLWPLLADRIFVPLGITMNDLRWRDNWYRPSPLEGVARRELGSGIRADVDAMARIGHLYLRGGCWDDQQLLPEAFIDEVRVADPSLASVSLYDPVNYPDANNHYGLLWWNNADGTLPGVPLDAYW